MIMLMKTAVQPGTTVAPEKYQVVNRVVVQELESWYFGDWNAVCAAYPRMDENQCKKTQWRMPDAIDNAWESFESLLKKRKCLSNDRHSRLPKIATAKNIARHMAPERNVSASFVAFRQALLDLR